jgi:hypothetical protein
VLHRSMTESLFGEYDAHAAPAMRNRLEIMTFSTSVA